MKNFTKSVINNFDNLFVNKNLTIKDAMKHMDKASKKILFVMDKKQKLLGTITDGDIRRWILTDGDLSKGVDKIYNRKPVFIKRGVSQKELQKKMLGVVAGLLPVVSDDMKIVDIVSLKDLINEDVEKDRKEADLKIPVVIMAGGQGSRLDPFTRILPKALIPIGDKPIVEVIISNFLRYTSGDIYLILGYKGEMIKSYFDNTPTDCKIEYIYEGKNPLGTAGGMQHIPKDFPDTFFLSNCDTMINARYDDIYKFHKEKGYDITVVGSMQHSVMPYGVIEISSGGELKRIEEKPEHDFLVNTGMYVVEKRILRHVPKKRLFHVTDLIKELKAKKGRIGVYPVSEKSWLDVGHWESYKETAKLY